MIYRIIAIMLFVSSIACKKEPVVHETSNNQQEIKKDSTLNKKIAIKKSAPLVDDWAEIAGLELEINQLFSREISTVKDIELLKTKLEELKKSIPEKFKKPAIEARVKVLETETLMLEQGLKDNVVTNVDTQLNKVLLAYNTFVGQIEALIIKEKDYELYK
ncbi:hypothetical protein [Pseudofulvibacter geojedonensis]|uniref:Lipoprotein n=1 Tax=Pseudofulvibacter geojedonensis TaxID=1123758 RepID=A0ABW3I1R4_9FLAO